MPVNGAYTLTIAAAAASFYTPSLGDLSVAINSGNDGANSISGSGFQTAEYLMAANSVLGRYTASGFLIPAAKTKVEFDLDGKYDTKGVNGKVKIKLQAKCVSGIAGYDPEGDKDRLCRYEITADDVQSLTLEPPDNFWVSSATIEDVTGKHSTVATNVQLQMIMNIPDKRDKYGVSISIQITDASYGLWFSNNWTGENTAASATAPVIQGGTIE